MSNIQRRAFVLFVTLAVLVGVYVYELDEVVEKDTLGTDEAAGLIDHVEKKPEKVVFHTTSGSFGGVNNVAHPGGAKAAANGEGIAFEDIIIPESNVGHAIKSLNRPQIVNLVGHYVHDEFRSPYASHLYNATKEELEERQKKFTEKMAKVREEWGAWDFRDPWDDPNGNTTDRTHDDAIRSVANFSEALYKDLPVEDFPADSWQSDEEYLARFIDEGKRLVQRVKEGIYTEYGWGKEQKSEEERAKQWKIHKWNDEECAKIGDDNKCGKSPIEFGIFALKQNAFDALVKKLLHAMMTNDEFYVVLGGHSAAAGHGNDWHQNRIMSFHYLMEPVFDKLGMRLVSRNMGMGGVGTMQFSFGGGDLYGETDLLEWDSGMTEGSPAADLFNKQGLLSGERVPILVTRASVDLMTESNGTAWLAKHIDGGEKGDPMRIKLFDRLFPTVTTYENFREQPWAARWIREKEKGEKFNAICWEPRSDFTPEAQQKRAPGSQVGWHPGNRQHQFKGRRIALLLLEALEVAFQQWEKGITSDGCPLATSYWHIGKTYETVRENLRTNLLLDPENNRAESKCEKMLARIGMERVCRVQMHGFGMWNPRAHVDFDFLNIIHPAPNGYKPKVLVDSAYHGFNVMPLSQAVPDDAIDVHAIAIATTSPEPDLDHSWIENDDNAENLTATEGVGNASDVPPPTRRWLREATEIGFRKGAEIFPASTVVKERKMLPVRNSHSPDSHTLRRQIQENATNTNSTTDAAGTSEISSNKDEIVPGRGWEVHGWTPSNGFCDGSAQSECNRHANNDCMGVGGNDKHMDVWGTDLSGWLVFTVPNVREGIIMVRMEWWCGMGLKRGDGNSLTKDWTEVNGGMTHDTTPWNGTAHRATMDSSLDFEEEYYHRDLGKKTKDEIIEQDFEFDWAINGKISTMNKEEWIPYTAEFSKNCAVWPLLNDVSMAERDWDGESVEVALRFRLKDGGPQNYPMCVSHVYYA